MGLLLDTHALLWWLAGDPLSDQAVEAVADGGQLVCVSAVSIWEAEIKASLGKLRLDVDLVEETAVEGFEPLSITQGHARRAGRLPQLHHDPFDRMLVAQALEESLVIVTRDPAIAAYGVGVLDC